MSNNENELESSLDKVREIFKKNSSYSFSIGEVMSLYKDGELIFQPEYQLYACWTERQKSKLIESILIGLPLQSFFIFQNQNGIFEVIDGVQRLFAIFDFVGLLKPEHTKKINYEKFDTLSRNLFYIPSFAEKSWFEFPKKIQLGFKRTKLHFDFLHYSNLTKLQNKNISDVKSELFHMLNNH